jgi:hypothetical protein
MKQHTTAETRQALRRLEATATPWPWGWNSYSGIAAPVPEGHPLEDYEESDPGDRGMAWICWIDGGPKQKGHGDALICAEARANAGLIEALRNAAPALLDDADALADALAEIKRLREVLMRVCIVAAKGDAESATCIAFIGGCSPEMRAAKDTSQHEQVWFGR